MADERTTSNVPPEPGAKPSAGKRSRAARPAAAREGGGNGLWDRPQLLNLISDALLVVGAAGLGYAAVAALSRLPVYPLREVVVTTPLAQVTTAQLEYAARSSLRGNFFTVDLDDAAIAGAEAPELPAALVFAAGRSSIRDTYVAGRRIVAEGRHRLDRKSVV